MSSYRLDRTSEDIMRELTAILRHVKDPRVSGMLSIVRVEVTNDMSYAKVYISAMEGLEAAKSAVKGDLRTGLYPPRAGDRPAPASYARTALRGRRLHRLQRGHRQDPPRSPKGGAGG